MSKRPNTGPRSTLPFSKKSEAERDRITRLSKKDQEKYAEEALEELNENPRNRRAFSQMLEGEFMAPPQGHSRGGRRKR